jgi:DNA polymerase III epsilon subunit-like protein
MTAALPQYFLSLDLEMNQPSGRIIQVGVAVGKRGQPHAEYLTRSWLLRPGEPIAENITALTGISDAHIAQGAVPLEQMTQELSALITEHTPFINPVTWGGGDSELLLRTIREAGLEFRHFGRRWLDVKTMASVDAMAQGRKPAGGLGSVMGRYKLPFLGVPHRADVDAFNTLRLFFHLLDQRARLHALVEQAKLAGVPT